MSISQVGQKHDRPKLLPEEFLSIAEQVVMRGEILVIGNDVDQTVSSGGNQGENDPRKTNLHPVSGKALGELEKNGQAIGFISNRSGWQVARMARDAELDHPTIVGTFGFELFKADAGNPDLGTAIIDERYQPYNEPITKILKGIRLSLLQKLGIKDNSGRQVELEFPTNYGPIIAERKGLCDDFPDGFATGYVFNLMQREKRSHLAQLIHDEFDVLTKAAMIEYPMQTMALLNVWGINQDRWQPDEQDRYSIKFEPLKKEGKAYGMMRLLRGIRERYEESGDPRRKIGMIVFAGDSDADAQGMHEASRAVAFHNKDVTEHTTAQSLGIWVRPDHDEPEVRREADLIVEGSDGYAELLNALANRVSKYKGLN